jgi:hypothetical protein
MPTTYEPIATTTLGSATATVTFDSIPGTYTDLVLVIAATNTGGNTDLYLRVNSDTGTNYSYTYLSANGTSALSGRVTSTANVRMGYYGLPQSTFDYVSTTHIMNYANTTTFKTWLTRSNAASKGVDGIVALWRSTSAITRLDVRAASDNFGIGSTFTLYGIKAA